MRRIFHILAILLFALITAWLYEVYYMRGGQLSWSNPVAQFVTEKGWWDTILWFDTPNTSDKNAEQPKIDKSKQIDEKQEQKLKWLMTEYATWSLDAINFNRLWLLDGWDFTYSVLEYCAHTEELCQDAHEDDTANEIVTLMRSDAWLMRKPFIWDLWWADAFVWLGESCVDEKNIDGYHNYIYKNWAPNSQEELQKIWEKISIDWFEACISWWSAEIFITQQMKLWNSIFGITKIPSYVLIDNANKNRVLIPGLYPLKEIWEVITKEFFE